MDKTVIILIGAGVCCVVIGFALFVKLLTTKSNDDDETTGNRKLLDEEYAENFKECFENTGNIEEALEQLAQIYLDNQFMYNLIVSALDYIRDEQGDYETALEKINVDSDVTIMKMHNDAIKKALNIDTSSTSSKKNKTKKKVEKVDLFEVFEEVHEVVNYIAKKKNIKVKYEFKNKDIDLWEYSGYIRQILLNIISNAIKYTGENGSVNIKQYIKAKKVFIEVKDKGIGIPLEDIDRIFERFYRVDKARSRSVGGTGLGLAITKHMVKALNGNIKVESELGVGSKFIIELPFNTELAKKVS